MIITICGSMRYISEMLAEYERLSLKGHLVYLPVILSKKSDDLKEQLQQLHFRKIQVSDCIFVVNPDGYIGEGTLAEIEYAKRYGISVEYLE